MRKVTTIPVKRETYRQLVKLKFEYSAKKGEAITWDDFLLEGARRLVRNG